MCSGLCPAQLQRETVIFELLYMEKSSGLTWSPGVHVRELLDLEHEADRLADSALANIVFTQSSLSSTVIHALKAAMSPKLET